VNLEVGVDDEDLPSGIEYTPTILQQAFINSPADETLYGGARGGGKTFAVVLDWLIHSDAHGKYARGIVFRRSIVELEDFIEAAKDVLGSAGHRWMESKKTFISLKGAKFRCRYLENDDDARLYQGHAYSRVYVEEIGAFPSEAPIRKLLACLRPPFAKGPPIRCQLKATANPGGAGQTWVKARYIDPSPPMRPFSIAGRKGERWRVFIPAKLADNPYLMENDPTYVDRLADVGSEELVKAWLEGDWDSVVGQYFREFNREKHVIPTVPLPAHWKTRYRTMDWGSSRPYCVLWFAVSDGSEIPGVDTHIPRGALVVYRELYGWNGKPNEGRRQHAREVAEEIKKIEPDHVIVDQNHALNKIDPSTFATNGGPSIAEEMARAGVWFKRADNRRVAGQGASGGWNQVRARLKGNGDHPMIFFMDCCTHLIRTLPMIPADSANQDDVDSESEDHAADTLRYGCMARPYEPPPKPVATNPNDVHYGRPLHSFTMNDAWKCVLGGNSQYISRG
jgi:Terminase large subunit, T4likevirus-type, N-terminal